MKRHYRFKLKMTNNRVNFLKISIKPLIFSVIAVFFQCIKYKFDKKNTFAA